MARYRVAPAADRDIDDQASYLMEREGIDLALRFHAAIDAAFAEIAGMPGGGQKWESDNPRLAGLRVWRIVGFHKHLAFYRITDDHIEIVRLLHGARDLDTLLDR